MSITTTAVKTTVGRLTAYVALTNKEEPLAIVYKNKLYALSPIQNKPTLLLKVLGKASRKFGINDALERNDYIVSMQTGELIKHNDRKSYPFEVLLEG